MQENSLENQFCLEELAAKRNQAVKEHGGQTSSKLTPAEHKTTQRSGVRLEDMERPGP